MVCLQNHEAPRPVTLKRVSSPTSTNFDRVLFAAWPFVAFILPAAACWGFGDLEYYFLFSASWIIIPLTGLLSLIPYFVARARGWRTVPGSSLGPLILNWWSLVVVVCTTPGKLTGGGRASVLELLTSETMSRAWNDRLLIAALLVGAASWLAVVVTTVSAGAPRPASLLQIRVGQVVVIAAPCLALLTAVLGGTIDSSHADAAQERPEAALARTLDEQLVLLAQREELTQSSLSEVRQLIAADGWVDAYPWLFRSCEREAYPCYDIYATASLPRTPNDHTRDALFTDQLHDAGWRSAAQPPYCHGSNITSFQNDDRQRLCVIYDDETISVALISPHYWGDLFALRDAAPPDTLIFHPQVRDHSASYRWDEWQSSALISGVRIDPSDPI